MMRRFYPYGVLFSLILVQGFTVLNRGGYDRLYWIPAAILLGLLLAGFLVGLNHGWLSPRFNLKTDLPLLGFLFWAAVSLISSVNREETLFEVTRLVLLASVYFQVAYALEQDRMKRALGYSLLGIGLFDAVYGLFGFISGRALFSLPWVDLPSSRYYVTGTFLNHNHFAGLMEMGIFLGLGLVLAVRPQGRPRSEFWAQRLFFSLPSGIMILALVLSLSRGGWASFLFGFFFFLALVWWHTHPSWSRILAFSLLMVIGISLFLFRLNREPLHERLATLEAYYQQPEEIAATGRLSIWKSALDMIKDHPGTGTGWGTFRSVYPSYRRDRVFHGIAFAHNDYLQIAAGMGLPGLGLFLLFLVMLFREGFRGIQSRDRDFFSLALPGVLAGLFALSVHELVDFNLMLPANALLFFSLAGMVAGRSRELP